VGLVAVVVVSTIFIVHWKRGGGEDAGIARDSTWQPPPQTVLASSMDVQPVPGWTARVGDLGLPPQSKIATSADAAWSQPLIGYLGDSGFLLASSPDASDNRWWLVGIDVRTGLRLFAPVQLDTGLTPPNCFLNGPEALLCLRDDVQNGVALSSTAWVIDARSGVVSFSGTTDLRTSPVGLRVAQVGSYAVAETTGQGVYGVGPRAETTWFVPGKGQVARRVAQVTNVAPQTLATQEAGGDQTTVFSVVDGKVVTPEVEDGFRPLSGVVYPGGFAVEVVRDQSKSTPDAVEFFQDNGKRVGHANVSGFLSKTSMDVPIVQVVPDTVAFSPSGGELAKIATFGPGDVAILVGSRLLIDGASSDGGTKQYDLQTGASGRECDVSLADYLATDGEVGIFESGNPNVGMVTKAMDLASCDPLWSSDSAVGSFRDVWRINTTLVQLSDDGTELMSLVAPN
jgi:hypothetical protein